MRYLAACVVLVCTYSQAGTVTGTIEGTADVSIAPIIAGQYPYVYTNYVNVPSALTYTYDIADQVFNFSITNSVYSFNTADFIGQTYPNSYGIGSNGIDERMTLTAFTYHVFYLQAYLDFSFSTFTLLDGGYTYSPSDWTGNGQSIVTSFTPTDPPGDPPAGLPEPSSVVMMAIGLLATLFRRLKCVSCIACS